MINLAIVPPVYTRRDDEPICRRILFHGHPTRQQLALAARADEQTMRAAKYHMDRAMLRLRLACPVVARMYL